MNVIASSHRYNRKHQRGLSLIELMVALTVSLMLLAGVITIVVNSNNNYAELTRASQQMENGRYAIQLLQDDIKLAGFWGELRKLPDVPAALPNPCLTSEADHQSAIGLPIQGYDSKATSPISACLSDSNFKPNTDILVIRRVSTNVSTSGQLKDNVMYLQANSEEYWLIAEDLDRTNDDDFFDKVNRQGASAIREYMTRIYFISPCNICGDDGDSIPTLKRLDLTTVGNGYTIVPLVEGIEDLQIDYGLDTSGDGSANSYTDEPIGTGNWENVVALRINVLARNLERSSGYEDVKSYTLGLANDLANVVGPFNDAYKRHVFSAVVRAVNPSGRRE